MELERTPFEGLFVLKPRIFSDPRGFFCETYNRETFRKIGLSADFVQDNLSQSSKGVLRGLHFQKPPHAQLKLVQALTGSVLDIVVDIRTSSATYSQHFSLILSSENRKMLWIPEGFAHGFLALEDETLFSYKVSRHYNRESEDGLMWNDPTLNIDWGTNHIELSEKDTDYIPFQSFNSLF